MTLLVLLGYLAKSVYQRAKTPPLKSFFSEPERRDQIRTDPGQQITKLLSCAGQALDRQHRQVIRVKTESAKLFKS